METELAPSKKDPTLTSRSALIIERAPLPIVEVQGSAHRVYHVNSAFCRLLGKTKGELIGKSFADIVHGGDKCVPILDRVYQTGEAATHAHEDDSDPASSSWLYAIWPALDENEQPVGVIIQMAKTANLRQDTVVVNEALLIAGLRQHELWDTGEKLNVQLQAEIIEHRQTKEKLRQSELAAKRALDYAEATLRTTPVPFLVLRSDLRVNTASEAFYTDFNIRPAETEGRMIYEIGNGQWNIPKLRELLEEIIPKKNVFNGFEVTHEFATIGTRTMLLNARRMDNAEGVPERILLAIQDITERSQAEEMQSRLGAIVSSADDGILSKTLDGVVTTWNASAERLFGYTAEEIIGNPNLHLTPPDLLDEEKHILKHILADEPVKLLDTQRLAKDGRRLQVSLTISPLKDATGKVVGASKIVRDITERKKAEAALRASEEFSRTILESSPDCVKVLDREGRLQFMNTNGLCAMEIDDFEPFRNQPWWNLWGTENTETIKHALATALESGTAHFQALCQTAKGTMKWWDVVVGQVAGSNPLRLVSISRDLTERNQAVDELRLSEERFRVAALAVSNIIWTNNAQGMMEGEQPGWAQFTGQTPGEYQGYGWARAVHPEDAQATIDAWNVAVAEKRLFQFEHRVRRHDGAWRSCSVRAVPVFGGDGEIREWVGVHNDITERERNQAALIEAKELAEAASNAKDNFLATLSHELRTPLTPVLMTAIALASDQTLPAEAREQLDMMRRNIELEARLIDDLLDLTRIIHGKLIIAPVTADIHDLLQHTDEILRSDGLGKRLRVTLKLDAARHHALADPARLQQVFWNLLRNAVKFTPDGGTITVSTRNDAEGRILISVADSGIGIREEVLSQIFNAFEQADTTGEHRYGGLGLGLAISSAIVTAHGGQIKAESEGCGHGADFTVTLGTAPAPTATSQPNAQPAQPARALSLLVIEDHEATRTVLERLLTLSGHRVITASTMHDALAAYEAARFDAVISDLGLPDGSGIDLMVQIQRIRPVPAIALSGYGMEADLYRTKEAGFFAHLVKPVKVDQLKQLLTQIPALYERPDNP